MPAVRQFCCCAFWAFLWNYALNVTLFPAMVVMDQRRQARRLHFCCPCVAVADAAPGRADERRRATASSPDLVDAAVGAVVAFARRAVSTKPRCGVVVLACLAGAVASATRFPRLDLGIEPRDVVPDDSYMVDFFDAYDVWWPNERIWRTSLVVRRGVDYSNVADREALGYDAWMATPATSLFGRVEAQRDTIGVVGQPTATWLREALEYTEAAPKSSPSPRECIHVAAAATRRLTGGYPRTSRGALAGTTAAATSGSRPVNSTTRSRRRSTPSAT